MDRVTAVRLSNARHSGRLGLVLAMCCCILPGLASAQSMAAGTGQARHLSAPSTLDPLEIYRGYLQRNRSTMGLATQDVDGMVVQKRLHNARTGATHLYMRQQLGGIDVIGTEHTVTVDRAGRLLPYADRMVRGLATRTAARGSRRSAADALRDWAAAEGLAVPPVLAVLRRPGGPTQAVVFAPGGLARQEITARLAYLALDDGSVRLTWNVALYAADGRNYWNLYLDADSGAELRRENWVKHDSYRVVPPPLESPDYGPRSLVTDPADAAASPFGWHDTNGVPGAEFTDTRGNNVRAQEDTNGNDAGGFRPNGGAQLSFDFPFDPAADPASYQSASITNLYFWNSYLHDVLYQYGFDEAAGNFQESNYGRGGRGGDAVLADTQDGSGFNNAQFLTLPDGSRSVMEMFVFFNGASLNVLSPGAIAGPYAAGNALFGTDTRALTGDVVLGTDAANAAGPSTTDGCSSLSNAGEISGNIALVDRGTCLFVEKTANAQAAGATGIIIANNAGDDVFTMSGDGSTLGIPPVLIGQSDGARLKSQLGDGVRVRLATTTVRDSALDNGIVVHEYVHGLTNRLTGGAGNAGCLDSAQAGGMGEGWSDWFALAFTATRTDSAVATRGVGNYALGEPPSGPGFRNFPYSRDLGRNPHSLADIAFLNQPHGVGEVWAASLWDLYWAFVDHYGFDPDLYTGAGGNNRLLQLVVDALKIQPCEPTFVQARDAVLSADLADSEGRNRCLIWASFARRGLGVGASAGSASNVSVVENFDVPADCAAQCGDGAVQPGEQCDDANDIAGDGCAASCRLETTLPALAGTGTGASLSVTIAGVTLSVPTTPGQSPDGVAAAVVAAINASSALQALRVSATVSGAALTVSGAVAIDGLAGAGLSLPVDARTDLSGSVALDSGLNALGAPASDATVGDRLRALPAGVGATSLDVLRGGVLSPCTFAGNAAEGPGCALTVGSGDAFFLRAGTAQSLGYDETIDCPTYALGAGVHLLSLPCVKTALGAAAFLAASGLSTIQSLDAATARWRSVTTTTAAGSDIGLRNDLGYLVFADSPVTLRPPRAQVGFDRGVNTGTVVALDGSASSDPDGAALEFLWRLTEVPAGSVTALVDPDGPMPTFSPDLPGTYRVQLQVANGLFESAPDEVVIRAFAPDAGASGPGVL